MTIAILLFCVLLAACGGVVITPDLEQMEQALSMPLGTQYAWHNTVEIISEADLHRIGFSKAVDMPDMELSRLDPPVGFRPVGMTSSSEGYLLENGQSQTLWLYAYTSGERSIVLDYRDSKLHIGKEIVFNQRWLIWLELDPLKADTDGIRRRTVRLVARDLASEDTEENTILDEGICTAAEGFYLPFDSLALDGSNLAYRRSSFSGGLRDTEVVFIDLSQERLLVLDRARGVSGRQILNCSIADTLVAWDLQVNYQVEQPGFPPRSEARYSIYSYETDSSKLTPGSNPLTTLTRNDFFYNPCLYRGNLLALRFWPTRATWFMPRGGGMYVTPLIDHRTFDTGIVQINYQFGIGRLLVHQNEYALDLLEYLIYTGSPRSVQRSDFYAGRRLLSWQSNVGERHMVYDMDTFQFIELPVYFSDAYLSGVDLFRIVPMVDKLQVRFTDMNDLHLFTIYPNLLNIRVTPIPGADADYLYFEHVYDLEPPYILVIRG